MSSRADRDARYSASAKGRARHARYNVSPRGRDRVRKYRTTAAGLLNEMRQKAKKRGTNGEAY